MEHRSNSAMNKPSARRERPISRAYPELDSDLARDNLENDLSAADLQDL